MELCRTAEVGQEIQAMVDVAARETFTCKEKENVQTNGKMRHHQTAVAEGADGGNCWQNKTRKNVSGKKLIIPCSVLPTGE